MYQYVDWMSCSHCGRSNCLFKIRVDSNHKKLTGSIRYMSLRMCQVCYREIERDKRAIRLSNPKELKKINDRQNELRKENPERYNEYQRKSYIKHRAKRLEYNYFKRKKVNKDIPDIVIKARMRESIVMSQYVNGTVSNYRRKKNR